VAADRHRQWPPDPCGRHDAVTLSRWGLSTRTRLRRRRNVIPSKALVATDLDVRLPRSISPGWEDPPTGSAYREVIDRTPADAIAVWLVL
jgi:hypothetical protein